MQQALEYYLLNWKERSVFERGYCMIITFTPSTLSKEEKERNAIIVTKKMLEIVKEYKAKKGIDKK